MREDRTEARNRIDMQGEGGAGLGINEGRGKGEDNVGQGGWGKTGLPNGNKIGKENETG